MESRDAYIIESASFAAHFIRDDSSLFSYRNVRRAGGQETNSAPAASELVRAAFDHYHSRLWEEFDSNICYSTGANLSEMVRGGSAHYRSPSSFDHSFDNLCDLLSVLSLR